MKSKKKLIPAIIFIASSLSAPVWAGTFDLTGKWPSNNGGPDASGNVPNYNVFSGFSTFNPNNMLANQQPFWSTPLGMWSDPPSSDFHDHPGDPFADFNVTQSVQSSAVVDEQGNIYYADAAGRLYKRDKNGGGGWTIQLKPFEGNYSDFFIESPVLSKNYVYIGGSKLYAVRKSDGAVVCDEYFDNDIAAGTFKEFHNSIEPSQMMLAGKYVIYGIGHAEEVREGPGEGTPEFVRGKIVAFLQADATESGKAPCDRVWTYHSSRHQGLANGKLYGPGVGTFAGGAVDKARHLLFWGVGQNYTPGPDSFKPPITPPINPKNKFDISPYSNSLLAIDYLTGELKWHYQYVSNDTFGLNSDGTLADAIINGTKDLNVSGHPQLFTVQLNGASVPVVGARAKDGTYRIFKRDQLNYNPVSYDLSHYDIDDPNGNGANRIVPVAAIQLDPGSAWNPNIGAEVIYDNGVLYITSNSFIKPFFGANGTGDDIIGDGTDVNTTRVDANGELIPTSFDPFAVTHFTADDMPGLNNYYESATMYAINLQKLIDRFQQIKQQGGQAFSKVNLICAPHNIIPNRCRTGDLDDRTPPEAIPQYKLSNSDVGANKAILWRKVIPQSSVLNSSGLSLINKYIVFGDLNGRLRFMDTRSGSAGNIVGPRLHIEYTTPLMDNNEGAPGLTEFGIPYIPILGGVTAVDNRLLVPMGYDFQNFKTDSGGMAVYKMNPNQP